jgi:hypothetical protein
MSPPAKFSETNGWGQNVQRTMRLLATSMVEKRNTVRLLFYRQTITEQKWEKIIQEDLPRRFTHANLIENCALDVQAARNRCDKKGLNHENK